MAARAEKDFLKPTTTCAVDGLIIVDVQNGFISPDSDLVVRIGELAQSFPAERTWWLKFRNHPGSMYMRHLGWGKVMVSPETDIVSPLRPLVRNVAEHTSYSPPEKLIETLKDLQGDRLDFHIGIAGLDTDACVMAHVIRLWDHDIRPRVLRDHCASSRGEHLHRSALDMMRRQFGNECLVDWVTPAPDIRTELAPRAPQQAGPATPTG